jgi:hypothetical protein
MSVDAPHGYLHRAYAASLSAFGDPLHLGGSGAWLLERAIPGADGRDAMGCYPLFCCRDWTRLAADLDTLRGRLVSVVVVTDPFGAYDEALLRTSFDHVVAYKEHLVADLSLPREAVVSKHHRYYARRALASLTVTESERPVRDVDAWTALYEVLVRRHALRGIKAFGRDAFARQLGVPGARLFLAWLDGVAVGAQIWYVSGDVAYNHLQAASDVGYARGAAYALYDTAMRTLAGSVRWLHIGAGAGAREDRTGGLHRFKAGWASTTRTAYLCGRVLDPAAYARACERADLAAAARTGYFPAYRAGELA